VEAGQGKPGGIAAGMPGDAAAAARRRDAAKRGAATAREAGVCFRLQRHAALR
jgi:hypothetical protein